MAERGTFPRGDAMTLTVDTRIDDAAIGEIRSRLRGDVLGPDDVGYDAARSLWNGMIERRPAVIARCQGVEDIRRALAFARARGLLVSVRGGGHNVTGNAVADGGLMVDLSAMRSIRIEPGSRMVRVEPGVPIGELDRETQAHGLAVPAGIVTTTGVAGLTLGGGIGWLMRRHGLTIDRLRSVDVVTASGELVRASEGEHADLFWGIRGGGGNFGVVTSFEFEAVAVGPEVVAGALVWPIEKAPDVLRRYAAWSEEAPEDVTTIPVLRTVLPVATFPPELHGRRVLVIAVTHAGPVESGDRAIAPLRALGEPILDLVRRKPFREQQAMFDASVPWGHRYYWKTSFLPGLADGAIDVLVDSAVNAPQPWSYTILFQLGGAIGRLAAADTAYEDRSAAFAVNFNGMGAAPDEDRAAIDWARGQWEALRAHALPSGYVNFLMDEGQERVASVFGPEKYDRLTALKARWDPDNVFRLNQNVPPREA
jgi:FAD/FMN-containing dehydrogenase